MPKVFIPAHSIANMRRAKEFGEVVILHDSKSKDSGRLGLAPGRIFNRFAQPINTYEPDDMILMDGATVFSAVAAAMAATISNRLSFLVHDHESSKYVKRTLYFPVSRARTHVSSNPMVWTTTDSHDVSDAERFGEIRVLISCTAKPPVSAVDTRKIMKMCLGPLKTSGRSDFLLLGGPNSFNVIPSAILARRHGKVNFLIYNHQKQAYMARTMDVSRDRIRDMAS